MTGKNSKVSILLNKSTYVTNYLIYLRKKSVLELDMRFDFNKCNNIRLVKSILRYKLLNTNNIRINHLWSST